MIISIINFMIITLLSVMLELASPIHLRNAQRCQNKVNDAKDAALFHQHFRWNYLSYFKLQLLCRAPYFGEYLLNAVAIKNHKKLSVQKRLCFPAKNVNEIDQLSFLLMIVLIQNVTMLSGIMLNVLAPLICCTHILSLP